MKVDLNLLPVVVALYEVHSVSRTAQRLGMSQPAVSAALGRLRKALGDPLFVRTSAGMEPTPRMQAMIDPAREVLARIQEEVLSEVAFDPATTTRTISFALSDIGEMVFLPKLIDAITREAPNVSIRSVTLPPAQVERGLEEGEIDLAAGYFPDLKRNNFFQQRLFSHRFVCLLRADHPIRGNQLTLKQFLGLGHAVVRAEGRSQEIFERFLERKRVERRVVLLTPHFMSIPYIIAKSDLVVTVPLAVGVAFAKIANIKLVKPPIDIPSFDLKQHWHRKYNNDPKNRWLRAIVARLFNDKVDEWKEFYHQFD